MSNSPAMNDDSNDPRAATESTHLAWSMAVRQFFHRWEQMRGSRAADMYELRFARICRRYLATTDVDERRHQLRRLQKLLAEMTLAIALPLEVAA